MNNSPKTINAEYCPAERLNWKGRKSNPDIENQYWHQEIKLLDLEKETPISGIDIAILGYVCDEGVRRNRGRIGAHKGPKSIRDRLAKLPIHFENKQVADAGDVICNEDDMEACQLLFSEHITNLIRQRIFPIAIGGGHDMSYAHFMGIWNVVSKTQKKELAL